MIGQGAGQAPSDKDYGVTELIVWSVTPILYLFFFHVLYWIGYFLSPKRPEASAAGSSAASVDQEVDSPKREFPFHLAHPFILVVISLKVNL